MPAEHPVHSLPLRSRPSRFIAAALALLGIQLVAGAAPMPTPVKPAPIDRLDAIRQQLLAHDPAQRTGAGGDLPGIAPRRADAADTPGLLAQRYNWNNWRNFRNF